MSHTFRIYNNPRLKKTQRYNLDDIDIHPFLGIHINRQVGIPLTFRSWICMGNCRYCRDPNKDQKTIRKRNKESLKFQLREEL